MKINSYYPNVAVSLPLQNLTRWAVSEIHQEMRARRHEALQNAPALVISLYDEVLQLGAHSAEEGTDTRAWEDAMRRLEEALSLYCAYELRRWLSVFCGLRVVLEREAKRRQGAREVFSRQPPPGARAS